MFPIQLVRLTNTNGNELWINPDHIIFAEQYQKKAEKTATVARDPKSAEEAKPVFQTILHVAGKEPKVFVKESPAEINKILRSLKRTSKVEKTTTFG